MYLRSGKKYEFLSLSKIIYLARIKASGALLVPVEIIKENELVIWSKCGKKSFFEDGVRKGFLNYNRLENKYYLRIGLKNEKKNIIFISSIQKELKKYGIKSNSSFFNEFVL